MNNCGRYVVNQECIVVRCTYWQSFFLLTCIPSCDHTSYVKNNTFHLNVMHYIHNVYTLWIIISSFILFIVIILNSYFAALTHCSYEERVLQRHIEASTRDANIWINTARQYVHNIIVNSLFSYYIAWSVQDIRCKTSRNLCLTAPKKSEKVNHE